MVLRGILLQNSFQNLRFDCHMLLGKVDISIPDKIGRSFVNTPYGVVLREVRLDVLLSVVC